MIQTIGTIYFGRAQAVTLRALGTSLADVAAFMHEVELEIGMLSQGTDRRGVDRLRLLAFRMAGFPRQNKVNHIEHSSYWALTDHNFQRPQTTQSK